MNESEYFAQLRKAPRVVVACPECGTYVGAVAQHRLTQGVCPGCLTIFVSRDGVPRVVPTRESVKLALARQWGRVR